MNNFECSLRIDTRRISLLSKDYPARILYCPFSPSVEIAKEEACCLPDLPENLSQSATPVPLIIGYNECEFVCSGNCELSIIVFHILAH